MVSLSFKTGRDLLRDRAFNLGGVEPGSNEMSSAMGTAQCHPEGESLGSTDSRKKFFYIIADTIRGHFPLHRLFENGL